METPEELDEAFRRLAEIDIKIKAKQANFNQVVTALREEMDAELREDLEEKKLLDAQVREFLPANRDVVFGDRKHVERRYAELSLTVGRGAIAFLQGHDEASCIKLIKKTLKSGAETYYRIKEELNKQTLITLPPAKLAKLGLCIKKDEKFEYKLKSENAELVVAGNS